MRLSYCRHNFWLSKVILLVILNFELHILTNFTATLEVMKIENKNCVPFFHWQQRIVVEREQGSKHGTHISETLLYSRSEPCQC